MVLTKKRFEEIYKFTVEIETDITADDAVSKIVDKPLNFPIITLWEKFEDYKNRVEKNPNSTRNKENLEYLKYLIRQRNIEIQENPQEIEKEIIERNTQEIEKENISGIYGYFDRKKEIYIYIGKDSNIGINLRDMQHHTNDSQQINRILRNDAEGRYEYRVIEVLGGKVDVKTLDERERHWIVFYNTYHYENPQGMNFTRGGETTFGIQTEAKIDYAKVTKKINNSLYKGERDGIHHNWNATMGPDGSTFVLTTNGGGEKGRIILINKDGIHTKRLTNATKEPDKLIKRFLNEEGFTNKSTIIVSETFKKKYPHFNIKKYGF